MAMVEGPKWRSARAWVERDGVGHLQLGRPQKSNAIDEDMWTELPAALQWLQREARVVVLSAQGRNFCAGIDLPSLMEQSRQQAEEPDPARQRYRMREFVLLLQDAMTAFERCPVPVLAAVHGACIGGGIDMITACDIRFATEDAQLSVKEVDMAIVADMGTLQRLPTLVGHGTAAELALTGRMFSGAEARVLGLVSRTFADQQQLMAGVTDAARQIAAKSPLAVVGTKRALLRQRGRTVEEGLEWIATWNAAMLAQGADLRDVFAARAASRPPRFAKL